MNKRVLIYSPFAAWSPHFETDLELAQRALDEGDEVTFLHCGRRLPAYEANPGNTWAGWLLGWARLRAGISWLGRQSVRVDAFPPLGPEERAVIASLREAKFESLDELREFEIDGSDIGMAALSSAVDMLQEPHPDMTRDRAIVRRNLQTAAIVHFSLSKYLDETKPDALMLFNGRMASLRPAMRAAQQRGIEVLVHERGGYLDQFSVTRGNYPHHLEAMKRRFEQVFDTSDLPIDQKRAEGAKWFEERLQHHVQNWESFAGKQVSGALPPELADYELKIGVFLSTEQEFVAIQGWENPHYRDQNDGLWRILRDCADIPSLGFFIRVHPGMRGYQNSQTDGIRRVAGAFDNAVLLPADSPVDTYALLQAVDVVLTFGSTVTVEAMYLERPCILMGRQVVEDPTAVMIPQSHEDLIEVLREWAATGVLPPTPNAKSAAIQYGFAQRHLGIDFRYVQPVDVFRANLQRNGETRMLRHNRLLLHISGLEVRLSSLARRVTAKSRAWRHLPVAAIKKQSP